MLYLLLMIAKELISENLVPLNITDSGTTALLLMDEQKVSCLPVIDANVYKGLISENMVYNLEDPDDSIEKIALTMNQVHISHTHHVYEVIRLLDSYKIQLLPVLDDHDNYLGSIRISELVQYIAKLAAVQNPGGIIVLELNANDYLLSEIVQIVESNDALILGLYINTHTDSTKMDITIRLNKMDIGPVLQTFNRYNYIVKASFTETDYHDDLQDNYNSLMRYLNT